MGILKFGCLPIFGPIMYENLFTSHALLGSAGSLQCIFQLPDALCASSDILITGNESIRLNIKKNYIYINKH